MSLYTDDEVVAVHEFAWRNRDNLDGAGSINDAKELLDRIAPAIAARAAAEALRDMAFDLEQFETSPGEEPHRLRDRADEIEDNA